MKNATKTVVSTFGFLAGIAGLEHGVGEILQGNVAPEGIVILSWPDSELFRILGGEPAMTIAPNLLATGILACLLSLLFLIWVMRFIEKKHGALGLTLLSLLMLFFGGGFGPPILGIIISATSTRINVPLTRWRTYLSPSLRACISQVWVWFYGACILAWLFLFPGTLLLDYFSQVDNSNVVALACLFAFGSLLLTILTGFVHDITEQSGSATSERSGRTNMPGASASFDH